MIIHNVPTLPLVNCCQQGVGLQAQHVVLGIAAKGEGAGADGCVVELVGLAALQQLLRHHAAMVEQMAAAAGGRSA